MCYVCKKNAKSSGAITDREQVEKGSQHNPQLAHDTNHLFTQTHLQRNLQLLGY